MTREEILALEPGRELDALVAEHVLAWRSMKGPEFDYDGPCKSNDVLIPPLMSEEEALTLMPPKGEIPSHFLVSRSYSTDISASWEVVEKLRESHFYTDIRTCADFYEVWITTQPFMGTETVARPKLSEAICKAALLAVLEEAGA